MKATATRADAVCIQTIFLECVMDSDSPPTAIFLYGRHGLINITQVLAYLVGVDLDFKYDSEGAEGVGFGRNMPSRSGENAMIQTGLQSGTLPII